MIDTILPFYLAHVILAAALAYTRPSSFQRPVAVGLIVVCCLVSVYSTVAKKVPDLIGMEYVTGFIFHASHFLCLAKLSPPSNPTSSGREKWAINQLFEARWGIKDIPPFSRDSPTAAPSKKLFLLHRAWDLLWTVTLWYIMDQYRLNIYMDDFTSVPDGFLRRLSLVEPREWVIRVYVTVTGIGGPYLTLRACHDLAALLTVICGGSPDNWPPLFGSIADAYTLRRYYS